jgi:hypothetical protein
MVISGRMADVCAELERMVQHERTHAGLSRSVAGEGRGAAPSHTNKLTMCR